ncbi:MAG: MBL fold metallo-hydrolase [Actinomycetota bacterium]|nr:MBL fold metallo-hydrolase [Actinomycetota bacterium]
MNIKRLELGFFKVNCYILSLENVNIIIDPGADFDIIKNSIEENHTKPDFILNTHGHYDHIGAVRDIVSSYKIPFYIHEFEEPIITDPYKNISSFLGENELSLKTYDLIKNGDYEFFDDLGIDIINVPGHTPGSIVIKTGRSLFTGDLLFKGAIGRTDLPGGDPEEIKRSLERIKKMDKRSIIYPGHGEVTNLEYELKSNYYLGNHFLKEDS